MTYDIAYGHIAYGHMGMGMGMRYAYIHTYIPVSPATRVPTASLETPSHPYIDR
jgi:hypothetical protein